MDQLIRRPSNALTVGVNIREKKGHCLERMPTPSTTAEQSQSGNSASAPPTLHGDGWSVKKPYRVAFCHSNKSNDMNIIRVCRFDDIVCEQGNSKIVQWLIWSGSSDCWLLCIMHSTRLTDCLLPAPLRMASVQWRLFYGRWEERLYELLSAVLYIFIWAFLTN